MKHVIEPMNGMVPLSDAPYGLFYSRAGALCVKTEYGNNDGRIDAFIVQSGEFFWGGAKSCAEQRKVLVQPADVVATEFEDEPK